MRPLFLHLDDALDGQASLLDRGCAAGGRRIAAQDLGPSLRLWSRPLALKYLEARLWSAAPAGVPEITFAGSGDFHHVTPLLLERAIEASGVDQVTVVHFDNHPDWVRFPKGLHCGSWVGQAARHPKTARLITVGVCSNDIDRSETKGADLGLIQDDRVELYPYRSPRGGAFVHLGGREWPTILSIGEDGFADFLARRIQTRAVYLTIDKDVLRAADAVTNWDQGQTSFGLLRALIEKIGSQHRLIGADVVGDWSRPRYGGGGADALLKRGEALLDQPWSQPNPVYAMQVNEAINLRLLELFAEVCP